MLTQNYIETSDYLDYFVKKLPINFGILNLFYSTVLLEMSVEKNYEHLKLNSYF